MATKSETAHKQSDAITGLRIEHVSGGVDNSSDGQSISLGHQDCSMYTGRGEREGGGEVV